MKRRYDLVIIDTPPHMPHFAFPVGDKPFNYGYFLFNDRTFGFPGGNIEHTMLVAGQCYFDRNHAHDPQRRFYQFGDFENLSICGSSTYPCGSVAGTPAYMCVRELLPHLREA